MIGLRFLGKALVLAALALSAYVYNQSSQPKRNLNRYAVRCQQFHGLRYYAVHLQSHRRIYIYTRHANNKAPSEACILADNGYVTAINWYSITRRKEIDFNKPDVLEDMQRAKNKIALNGSVGDYHVISPTTVPLFHVVVRARKDLRGTLILNTGYTDDRSIFVGLF